MLVVEQVAVFGDAERLVKPGRGIRADSQEPVSQASLMQVPYPFQALTDSDSHRRRLGLAGQCGELLDKLVSLGVLNVEAHVLPFYPTLATRVPSPAGPPSRRHMFKRGRHQVRAWTEYNPHIGRQITR